MTSAETQNDSTPVLLLLKGHPGSGKSTLAKLIASDRHFTLSDKDDARDCLKAAEDATGPARSWDLNALSYNIMFTVAATQLSCGLSVVVDCPLSKVELYHQALVVAKKVLRLIQTGHSQSSIVYNMVCFTGHLLTAALLAVQCSNCSGRVPTFPTRCLEAAARGKGSTLNSPLA